jgi:hypothetical protein
MRSIAGGRVAVMLVTGVAGLALPVQAVAQAWVPPAGVGAVTVAAQHLDYTGHRNTAGESVEIGMSIHNRVDIEVDYAITDRLSITAGIPFVFTKYTDPNALPLPIPYVPNDECHCWQSGFQDFAFTARYNLANGAFALTPSVAAGLPSHEYGFRGEAVLGERLRELRLAVDGGVRLDRISPRLSVQSRYSYAFVEKVIDDVPVNRSNFAVEGGISITRQLAGGVVLAWQRVHGGLRVGSGPGDPIPFPGEIDDTPERLFEHDRLLRDNNFRLGVSLSYAMPSFDIVGSYLELVSGTDSHTGRALTIGISWPFEITRAP